MAAGAATSCKVLNKVTMVRDAETRSDGFADGSRTIPMRCSRTDAMSWDTFSSRAWLRRSLNSGESKRRRTTDSWTLISQAMSETVSVWFDPARIFVNTRQAWILASSFGLSPSVARIELNATVWSSTI